MDSSNDALGVEQRHPWRESSWWIVLAIVAVIGFGFWCVVVAMTAKGASWWGAWDYETTGQLGDSFGVVSAIMTTAAAIFTARTLADTRRQTGLAEQEAADRKVESEAAKEAAKRAQDEQTFFRLLEQRQLILSHVKVESSGFAYQGADAIHRIIQRLDGDYYGWGTVGELYDIAFTSHEDDLGNYFRFTYHIVRFADGRFGDDAYSYLRFLRAQMTGSEQAIIGLNCAFGAGAGAFEEYVNAYSMLHEMPDKYRATFGLDDIFQERAFDPSGRAEIVSAAQDDDRADVNDATQ